MSGSKVLTLAQPRSNDKAVEVIEQMLAAAKSGEVVEVMALTVCRGGELASYWTASDDLLRQLGMATRMAANIQKRMDKA